MAHIAHWWEQASQGKVPDMEWGMPYNSSHPSNWKWDGIYEETVYSPNAEHYGTHDVSRSEGKSGPFDHYLEEWGKPEAEPNFDLPNADEIAHTIFDWYRK